MCVLLCANSKVREWLDIPLAREYRQSMQLCPAPTGTSSEPGESTDERFSNRSAWLQAHFRYSMQTCRRKNHLTPWDDESASSGDWPKALEAIAKTWGRILSLVGLRW